MRSQQGPLATEPCFNQPHWALDLNFHDQVAGFCDQLLPGGAGSTTALAIAMGTYGSWIGHGEVARVPSARRSWLIPSSTSGIPSNSGTRKLPPMISKVGPKLLGSSLIAEVGPCCAMGMSQDGSIVEVHAGAGRG